MPHYSNQLSKIAHTLICPGFLHPVLEQLRCLHGYHNVCQGDVALLFLPFIAVGLLHRHLRVGSLASLEGNESLAGSRNFF